MAVDLCFRLRTIGKLHGEYRERTAQSGYGHHPVNAQSGYEQAHGCRNKHRGHIGADDQKAADRVNRMLKTAGGHGHNAGFEWSITTTNQCTCHVGDKYLAGKQGHDDATHIASAESRKEQRRLLHPTSPKHLRATKPPSHQAKKESGRGRGSLCQAHSGALVDCCDDPVAKADLCGSKEAHLQDHQPEQSLLEYVPSCSVRGFLVLHIRCVTCQAREPLQKEQHDGDGGNTCTDKVGKLQTLEKVQTKGQEQGPEQRPQPEQPVKRVQL